MKKSFLFMGCLALLAVGCNKEQNMEEPRQEEVPRHLTVDITVNNASDTRVVKTGWESGDKVYAIFDFFLTDEETSKKAYYLTMTYNGSSWTSEFSDPALEEYLLDRESGKVSAVYISDRDPVFEFQDTGYNGNLLMTNAAGTPGYFLSASEDQYTVEDGKLVATLNMILRPNNVVHFFIEGIDEENAGNYSFINDNFKSVYFNRFFYFYSSTTDGSMAYMGPWPDYLTGEYGDAIPGAFYKSGIRFCGLLNPDVEGTQTEYLVKVVDNNGTPDDISDDIIYSLTKTATLKEKDSVKLPALTSDKWTKSLAFEEHLEDGYFIYDGVEYNVVKLKDGKWWMAQNLAYLPAGYTPATDLTAVTAGVFAPIQINEGKTAAEFTTDPAVVAANGYLYQSEVALGMKVGDLTSVDDAKALEGAQGICPKGWHLPTLDDIMDLVGKSATQSDVTTAPYYVNGNGSIAALNADGFNMAAVGFVSIQDNTKTAGTLSGFMAAYPDHLCSGMFCGSSYAGVTYNTSGDETSGVKNLQFYGLMPMTNKASEDQYTCNGTKVSYRIAGPVRCVRDEE